MTKYYSYLKYILIVLALWLGYKSYMYFTYFRGVETGSRVNVKEHNTAYDALKARVPEYRRLARTNRNEAFTTLLADSIIPYWYGTDWDFYGTTENPRSGNVACGYFVSTTLRDAGFKIRRKHWAQQASSKFIFHLCSRKKTKWINGGDTKALKKWLSERTDGMYLLGLDTHIGFIEKKEGKLSFIHSSKWPFDKVVKEPFDNSYSIHHSDVLVIGAISNNPDAMKFWY